MRAIAIGVMLFAATAFAADEDAAMGKRVQDLLHAHQADVFGCVAAANGTVKGEMLVRVMVGADQHPSKAEVLKDQTGLPSVAPCLQSKMQKWDLASLKASTGDQVVFPLVFKPEALAKGEKRVLVPMSAQDAQGPQRFLIDDESIGEAPLASVAMLTLPANATAPAKTRKDESEEMVIYVLDGGVKIGADTLKAGDALWLGAHTDRAAMTPADKKPVKLLEIRAHGDGTGQKVVKGADAKSYKIAGGKASVKLLLDGSGAKLAVDEIDAEPGATIASHKHAHEDEELFFVSGRSTTTVGKTTYETAPGDAMRIPANVAHTMKVTEPLKTIQIYAPAGPEQRFKKEK
ncbi:MAG TPA: cupin domain-containing protein [Polyangia bacterium]|nr:cupin domain-containing protein [Polyangia bacterium]